MNFFNNFQPTYQPTLNNQPPRFNPEQFKQVVSQIDEKEFIKLDRKSILSIDEYVIDNCSKFLISPIAR